MKNPFSTTKRRQFDTIQVSYNILDRDLALFAAADRYTLVAFENIEKHRRLGGVR
jgi:hypothetical protein